MHSYLACFDITDDRARRHIVKELERYGLRVQKSVFEIVLSNDAELNKLQNRLKQWTDDEDDIRFYHLCLSCRQHSQTVDKQRIAYFPTAIIL